jgi:hypothetical protein
MTAGDHVRVLRHGTWDHAIDIGDRTVIRFTPRGGLERRAFSDFVAGGERIEVVVHREPVHRAAQVVRRAFSRFAETAFQAMFRDAEQFAVWCKNGRMPPAAVAPPGPVSRAAARVRAPAAPAVKARAAVKAKPAAKGKRAAMAKAPAKAKPATKAKAPAQRKPVAKGKPAVKRRARPAPRARAAVRKAARKPARRPRR